MTGPDGGFTLGVDLGTSHTVAMLRRPDGRTRPLLFDGQPLLPSATYRDTTGRLHVGRDAMRLGFAEPDRYEPNPKRHVDSESVLLGGSGVPVADLFAALLVAVAREAVATAGFLPAAVLTYPAAWGARRRAVLVEALARAGWLRGTPLLPEPVAAARYFADVLRRPVPIGSALAVFDFGAGTLDVAVVRNEGQGRFAVAASGGVDDLGGLDLDAALVEHLGKSLSAAEPTAWAALSDPVTLAQRRARRQFWDDVRGAKEMLSRAVLAPVPVPGVELAVHLTRDELEAAIDPLIRRGVSETATVIKAAGSAPAELAGLFLVGGSSRVPLVARLLHSELGIAPTVLEQPELPVAEGATLSVALGSSSGASEGLPATAPHPAPVAAGTGDPDGRYPPGLAAAATPAAPVSPAPHYAEPVDPWATAEAAAVASAGGPVSFAGSPPPYSPSASESWLASTEPERPSTARRAYRTWVLIVASVLALGLIATLTVIFWPSYRALDFQPLSDPLRVGPVVPVTYAFADAEVLGDRAYFANADSNGALGVVAANTGDGKSVWTSRDAGVAERWSTMVALPKSVALFTDADPNTSKRRMIILNADDGRKRWERTVDDDDDVYFAGAVAVLVDRTGHRLLGLKVDDRGQTAWKLPDPKTGSGTATAVIPATTSDDVSGPASVQGRAYAPDLGDDTRIVQLSADRSARVIDASNGTVVVKPRQSVAAPDDDVMAHNGRLFVRESDSTDRLVTYDLDKLGEPKVLYTAADRNRRLKGLVPCGADRACAIETNGYDAATSQVVSVDAAKGRHWTRAVPNADNLVPVGESVLVARASSPAKVTLLDPKGKVSWSRDGEAARLDAGNLLLFSKALSTSPDDPSLTGQHVGDSVVPLGALSNVRSATCGWDTRVLACVADKDFVLQKFTG